MKETGADIVWHTSESLGKESTEVWTTQEKEETLTKNMKRSPDERHTQTQTHVGLVVTNTDAFTDLKRVNACERMVKTASCERFEKVPPGKLQDRKEGEEGNGGKN